MRINQENMWNKGVPDRMDQTRSLIRRKYAYYRSSTETTMIRNSTKGEEQKSSSRCGGGLQGRRKSSFCEQVTFRVY